MRRTLEFSFNLERSAMETAHKIVKTQTDLIILSGVLLVGMLLIAYGYFQQSSITLISGLIVTGSGVMNGIFKIVIKGN
jgi:hypothetical protein